MSSLIHKLTFKLIEKYHHISLNIVNDYYNILYKNTSIFLLPVFNICLKRKLNYSNVYEFETICVEIIILNAYKKLCLVERIIIIQYTASEAITLTIHRLNKFKTGVFYYFPQVLKFSDPALTRTVLCV